MAFSPAHLLQILGELPSPRRCLVAFSGGCDSTVLLQAMAALREEYAAQLLAIHVHHGLQDAASGWAGHCEAVCREAALPLIRIDLALEIGQGESPEAVARQARYAAIRRQMQEGDLLLTAHHQDDQAETVLLQLLRGSGPSGLAAMPQCAAFGPGHHARPLLGFSRKQLLDYAVANGFSWIEDSSNLDTRHDRNFLRQRVMPLLAERWPGMSRTLSRSARHCAEARQMIDETALADLTAIQEQEAGTLPVQGLLTLSMPRRRAVLRSWIRTWGFQLPNEARLEQLQDEMLHAAPDRIPLLRWPGAEVRRYRGRLYLMTPLPPHDPDLTLEWDGISPLTLSAGLGTLSTKPAAGGVDPGIWSRERLQVRFRRGGERCQPAGRGQRHGLKKLFQEWGLPPWQRDRVPLIHIDGRLAAVGDFCICEPFQTGKDEPGISIHWERG